MHHILHRLVGNNVAVASIFCALSVNKCIVRHVFCLLSGLVAPNEGHCGCGCARIALLCETLTCPSLMSLANSPGQIVIGQRGGHGDCVPLSFIVLLFFKVGRVVFIFVSGRHERLIPRPSNAADVAAYKMHRSYVCLRILSVLVSWFLIDCRRC